MAPRASTLGRVGAQERSVGCPKACTTSKARGGQPAHGRAAQAGAPGRESCGARRGSEQGAAREVNFGGSKGT
jgi:hypothetical protein